MKKGFLKLFPKTSADTKYLPQKEGVGILYLLKVLGRGLGRTLLQKGVPKYLISYSIGIIYLNANWHKELEAVFSKEAIALKVKELAKAISADYKNKPLTIVATLKGSFIFLSDLVRELTIPAHIDFISVSSYKGTAPADKVKYHYGPLNDVKGKSVLILEDIIDTGETIKCVAEKILQKGAADVKVCALLKRESEKKDILSPHYIGFTIKEGFVVGYGLDYNEEHRGLKGIYRLPPQ